jgi:hypothetical protein
VGSVEVADFDLSSSGVTERDNFQEGGHSWRVRATGGVVKCFLASKFQQERANY